MRWLQGSRWPSEYENRLPAILLACTGSRSSTRKSWGRWRRRGVAVENGICTPPSGSTFSFSQPSVLVTRPPATCCGPRALFFSTAWQKLATLAGFLEGGGRGSRLLEVWQAAPCHFRTSTRRHLSRPNLTQDAAVCEIAVWSQTVARRTACMQTAAAAPPGRLGLALRTGLWWSACPPGPVLCAWPSHLPDRPKHMCSS